jgi:hypothetical protein
MPAVVNPDEHHLYVSLEHCPLNLISKTAQAFGKYGEMKF